MISKKSLSWPGFESWSQLFTAKKHGGLHSNYGGLHSNYGGQSPQPSQMTVDTVISVTPLFWRSDGTDHPPYRNYGAKSLWRWHCTALNIYCTVIAKPWLQCNHCNYDPQIQGSCDWMRCGHARVTWRWSSLFLTRYDAIAAITGRRIKARVTGWDVATLEWMVEFTFINEPQCNITAITGRRIKARVTEWDVATLEWLNGGVHFF